MRKTLTRVFAALLCMAMLATCAFMASAAEGFSDVKSSNWFYDYVTYMADKGIINGYAEDGTFRPNNNVDRKEFITMMVNTFGLTATKSVNYNDVPDESWYYAYYSKAAAQGFLTEVFDGNTMRPADELKREEAAALLMAYLDYPEDEKASTSKFEDYSEIDSDYKTYVLQAAKVGIIDGIEEDGEIYFRPDQTLTRAQAAKILSVAAGTIASDDIEDELESDVSGNLIVTKACTIENVDIPGNVIITEGASGTVNFVGCEIDGTVSVRSKAKVVFSNSDVNELNLDVTAANIEVKQSAKVNTLNAYNANAKVSFGTSASVDEFNVLSGSTGVSVSGSSGTIDTLNVKANSFTTTIEPDEINLENGISATIGGVSYKDGLKGKITTSWENGKEYLSFEAYKSGSVKYYYLTSSSVKKADFLSGYNSATKKNSFIVTVDTAMKMEMLGNEVSSGDFKYVAAALVDGTTVLSEPVVFTRDNTKASFNETPTVSGSEGKDLLKGTAATTGTLYYYYTNTSTVPASYEKAETAYASASASYKGNFTFNSTSVSRSLDIESTDSTYKYVVVFIKGGDDSKCDPVIITRATVSSSISSASIKESNGKDQLSGTAVTAAGQLYYYYTSTSTKPDKYSDAETAYAAVTNSSYKGEIALSSKTVSKDLGIESTDGTYKYVVVFLKGNDGTKYEPVILTKTVKTVEAPKLPPYILTTSEDGYDYLVITHTSSATVKVLYNSSAMNYDGTAFDTEYNANNKDVTGVLRLGYSGTASANKETKIKLGKSADITAAGYTKALIRIGNATPQKVDRIDDADGFNDDIAPSVLKTSDGKDIIAFTPYSGAKYGDKVMYMYVSSSKGYTSEAFLEAYEDVADHLKGKVDAGDDLYTQVQLDSTAKKSKEITEGYVAFMFIGSGRNYQPVTVARTSIGTCISGTPSVTYDVDKSSAFISLNAKLPFTLQYFVIEENIYNKDILAVMFNTGKMPDNTEIAIGELDSGVSTTNKVVAGKNDKLNLNEVKTIVNGTSKYLAIRAVTDGRATKYDPIVVPVNVNDDGINSVADVPYINFSSDNGKIIVAISANSNAVGKTFCFWYTNTEPKTEAQYNAIFKETKNSGSLTVTKTGVNTFEAGKWIDLADYKYFVYKVVDSTGKSMTPGYKEITPMYRQNADIILDSSTLAMLHVKPCDTATYDIYWFYSTTQIDVTRSNFMTKYGAVAAGYKNVKKDAKVSNANRDVIDVITNFAQPTESGATKYKYVYVCLYDTTLKKYYQPAELKLPANS